jgi:hypothetical protein
MELQTFLLLVEWGKVTNDGEGAGETWLAGDWIGKVNGESAEPTVIYIQLIPVIKRSLNCDIIWWIS